MIGERRTRYKKDEDEDCDPNDDAEGMDEDDEKEEEVEMVREGTSTAWVEHSRAFSHIWNHFLHSSAKQGKQSASTVTYVLIKKSYRCVHTL